MDLIASLAVRRQGRAFDRLLYHADRLAYVHDMDAAARAYQECLFWLSRHDVPNADALRSMVRDRLQSLQHVHV